MSLLCNKKSTEFHNLSKAKPQCQIAEIVANSHQKSFVPDTVEQAIREGFEPCAYCIGTFGDLLIGAIGALASPSDLAGQDLGEGRVSLSWTYAEDIVAHNVTFDVYVSNDPLTPFRTLLIGSLAQLSTELGGFESGGELYFSVVARRGALLSLPSSVLRVTVLPMLAAPGASGSGGGDSYAEAPGFPFQIDPKGSVFGDFGDSLLHGKILQLLLTSPGERVNLPEFGTRLRDLVFDPNNEVLAAATEFAVSRALQRFLSDELHVEKVQISSHEAELLVEILYLRKADLNTERLRVGIPIPR